MKVPKFFLLIFLFNGLTLYAQSLKEYRWENRLLILVSEKKDYKTFQEQKEALETKEADLKDRDLIIFLLNENSIAFADGNESQIDGAELRKELKIESGFKGIILVGKDGGVKMREGFKVEPQAIFDLIDSMPMRRAEMKN